MTISQTIQASAPAIKALDDYKLRTLSMMLLNSWTGEYSLRLKPLIVDEDYLDKTRNWAFPQVYHAPMYAAKAVILSAGGNLIHNEVALTSAMCKLADEGLYGDEFTSQKNPYLAVQPYRHLLYPPRITTENVLDIQQVLIDMVNAMAQAHEGFILRNIGPERYYQIVMNMPAVFRDKYVGERLTALLLAASAHE